MAQDQLQRAVQQLLQLLLRLSRPPHLCQQKAQAHQAHQNFLQVRLDVPLRFFEFSEEPKRADQILDEPGIQSRRTLTFSEGLTAGDVAGISIGCAFAVALIAWW